MRKLAKLVGVPGRKGRSIAPGGPPGAGKVVVGASTRSEANRDRGLSQGAGARSVAPGAVTGAEHPRELEAAS